MEILRGKEPSDIPIATSEHGAVVINIAKARLLGLEIDFDILSTAAKIFTKMSLYSEFNK